MSTLKDALQHGLQNMETMLYREGNIIRANETAKEYRRKFQGEYEKCIELNKELAQQLDECQKSIHILKEADQSIIAESYRYIENRVNGALDVIFGGKRRIQISEGLHMGKYPTASLSIITQNGNKRDIRKASGHGIAQIISLICIMCVIALTGKRRFIAIDEVLSGLDADARRVADDIIHAFANELGFQFIISEHGFIPKGAKVYELKIEDEVTSVNKVYVEKNGVYFKPEEEDDEESLGQNLYEVDSDNNITKIDENNLVDDIDYSNNIGVDTQSDLLNVLDI